MDIGISTASYFNRLQTEDAVSDIIKNGIGLTEIFLNSYLEYEPAFIDLLCERIGDSGLRVYSIHPMSLNFEPFLFSIHSRQYEDGERYFRKILDAGRRLGAGYYTMHGYANLSGAVRNVQMDRVAPVIVRLAEIAREYGITLTIENVSWCMCSHPSFVTELCNRIGAGTVKFTLDIKQAFRAGETPEAFIDVFGRDLANLHVTDVVTSPDGTHAIRMPGRGTLDYRALTDSIRKNGCEVPAIVEVYSDMYREISEITDSVRFLEDVLNG